MTEPVGPADSASPGAAEPVLLTHQAPDPLTYQACPQGCGTRVAYVDTRMATPGEPIEQTPVTGWFERTGQRTERIEPAIEGLAAVDLELVEYREHTAELCAAAAAGEPDVPSRVGDDDPRANETTAGLGDDSDARDVTGTNPADVGQTAGGVPPKLREAARRISALGDVLDDLGSGASDEVETCRDLARTLTDPGYRSASLTDEVFARIAAAILGEVDPR